MKLFKNIKTYFRAVVFDCRLRHCRREADRRRAVSGQKHLVINLNGRPVVVSKIGRASCRERGFILV